MQINNASTLPIKKLDKMADTPNGAKLKKACQDFEAIIIRQMLASMRQGLPKDGIMGNSYAQDMYQSMADDNLAQQMASKKGFGLADALFHQLSTPPKPIKNKVTP